jgi:hypothetical protein
MQTTPAGGRQTTTDLAAVRAAIPRESLPPGSGEIDAPDEVDEVEETLEAFRQLNGEAEDGPPSRDPGESVAEGDDDVLQVSPDDQFSVPGLEETPAAPAAAPTVEAPQPPVETQPEATPTAPQVAPTATAPSPQGEAPEVTFQQTAQLLDANIADIQKRLAEQVYTISDKDLDELQSDPKKVYARMMAQVHINAVSSVMRTIAQQMPVVVSGMLRAQELNSQAQDRFWGAFPQLNKSDPQHRQLVGTIAKNIRATNPNLSEADAIRFTGAQAVVMLGLQGAPAAQPPARRAAPQMPGRQVRQTQPAYSPAAARASPGAPGTAPKRNQWDLMSSLIQLDNQGRFDPAS